MTRLDILVEELALQWPAQLAGHLHYCIGLSGGVDSIVLLDVMCRIAKIKKIRLSAIHVNHGISSNSEKWASFCATLCAKYDIALDIINGVVIKIPGEGLENSARKFRYQAYKSSPADVMILAHHHDDLIETMLSQVLRGSDIHNIAAMHEVYNKLDKLFWRPFLNCAKADVLIYAKKYNLSNIDDESNQDNLYLRNFLRNDILPRLYTYDARVGNKLLSTLHNIQKSALLLDEVAKEDLVRCYASNSKDIILVEPLLEYSDVRISNIIAMFLREQNLALPSKAALSEFIRQLREAKNCRSAQLKLSKSIILQRDKNKLFTKNLLIT